MKEIILWFSSFKSKNYWVDYAMAYCSNKFENAMKYDKTALLFNRIEDWIKIGELKILFKVDKGPNSTEHIGIGDINQYWVEDLFDNNFEEFFMTIIKREIKNG